MDAGSAGGAVVEDITISYIIASYNRAISRGYPTFYDLKSTILFDDRHVSSTKQPSPTPYSEAHEAHALLVPEDKTSAQNHFFYRLIIFANSTENCVGENGLESKY